MMGAVRKETALMRTFRHSIFAAAALAAVVGGGVLLRAQTRTTGAPAAPQSTAAGHLTSPKEAWGHNVGDDYFLADYTQLGAYWHQLEKESNRIHIKSIGKTAEGRDQWMAVITSPQNYAKLDHYRDISARLSTAEGLTEAQAKALAAEGKAVVWIDGGLHASETLGAQQLLETVWQLVSGTDAETQRLLNDVIILCVPANPDGMELVSDWYMKHGNMNVPRLWNHYAGHDDNRDSFMNALPETTNVSNVMYREWYPQIMYNHHQSGPQGAVMFAPPFRDPFNYFFHPEIPADIDLIGSIIATRAIEEGKPGVVNRKGQNYSTWWNGGFRTTAYFHNQIGILTETIGSPDPQSVPFTTRFSIGDSSDWYPIAPHEVWHYRQSIDYSVTANKAVLDFASRFREQLLIRMYEMARDEIKWGSEDHWTFTPHRRPESARRFIRTIRSSCRPRARRSRTAAGIRPCRTTAAPPVRAAGARAAAVAAAGAAAPVRPRSGPRSPPRSCAIRAATSCRPTSPTSAAPWTSSTRSSSPASP